MPQLRTAAAVHGCSRDFPGCHVSPDALAFYMKGHTIEVERCDGCADERAPVRFEGDLDAAWSVKLRIDALGLGPASVWYYPEGQSDPDEMEDWISEPWTPETDGPHVLIATGTNPWVEAVDD